jgi:sulfur carrier protein
VKVIVNGEDQEVPSGVTVAGLVAQLGGEQGERGVAVAVDAEVVPRSAWAETGLSEGQRVEILAAIQGG